MKELLRSVIRMGQDVQEDLDRNCHLLQTSGLEFPDSRHQAIWEYVRDFYQAHHHSPDMAICRQHYTALSEQEALDQLAILEVMQPLRGGNFIKTIEHSAEARRKKLLHDRCQDAITITNTGLTIKKPKGQTIEMRGSHDAASYLMEGMHEIMRPALSSRLSGEVLSDGEDFRKHYEARKNDPDGNGGKACGIDQIDVAIHGARKGELWVHAAFTGHLKSSFMLTWAYNQAVYYGNSALIFSLEMKYDQVRNLLFAIHSAHGKFQSQRIALGIQQDTRFDKSLDYQKIRDGALSDEEEAFLFDEVVPDFESNPLYGRIHIEVADPDKMDFTILDMKQRAETLQATNPFDLLFIDHAGLMGSRGRYTNTTDKLNEVIRDCKKLSMGFNRGAGIPVITLFQINREGFKMAEKNGGKYNLAALASANEAERSADVVTATYISPEMRKQGYVAFQCLKSRDQGFFDDFTAQVDWNSRRLQTCYDSPAFEQAPQPKARYTRPGAVKAVNVDPVLGFDP